MSSALPEARIPLAYPSAPAAADVARNPRRLMLAELLFMSCLTWLLPPSMATRYRSGARVSSRYRGASPPGLPPQRPPSPLRRLAPVAWLARALAPDTLLSDAQIHETGSNP